MNEPKGSYTAKERRKKMLVKEFLSNKPDYKNVTFIKARARKDANTPFYHPENQETPIRPA